MLTWDNSPSRLVTLYAQTELVRMIVDKDPRTSVYYGQINNLSGKALRSQSDFATSDAARAWCEQTYRELLEAELSRVGGADLMGLLREVADYLYNPFEPDNQSEIYRRVRAVIIRA